MTSEAVITDRIVEAFGVELSVLIVSAVLMMLKKLNQILAKGKKE